MQERELSTARHIRCFGDLRLASIHTYACIDVYDLFRRVVNMLSSLKYSYLYLVVLHSFISNDPQKKEIFNKWKLINRDNLNVPFKTTVDVLNNVLNVPKFTNWNFKILKLMLLYDNFNESTNDKENINFNENNNNNDENNSNYNIKVPVLLISSSNDSSNYIQPVEPEFEKPQFKLKKRPFNIKWNHEGQFDINKLHKRFGDQLTDNDIDIITDDFLWPMIKFSPSMRSIDKISLILTGYLYSGEMDQKTPERFYGGKYANIGSFPNEVYQDIDFKSAESKMSELKIQMALKMRDTYHINENSI